MRLVNYDIFAGERVWYAVESEIRHEDTYTIRYSREVLAEVVRENKTKVTIRIVGDPSGELRAVLPSTLS